MQTTGRPATVTGAQAPQFFPGSRMSRMRCHRASSSARAPVATRVLRCPGLFGPPGARRASAPGDLIMQPVPNGLEIAVSVVFMISPLTAALFPVVPACISSQGYGPLMRWRCTRRGPTHAGVLAALPGGAAHGEPVSHLGREPAPEGTGLAEVGRAVEEHHPNSINHRGHRFVLAARALVSCRLRRGILGPIRCSPPGDAQARGRMTPLPPGASGRPGASACGGWRVTTGRTQETHRITATH